MAGDPLAATVTDHGSMPITLDEFAAITATTPAALRGRRDRDAAFPAPITLDASPLTYFLRDLAEWWASRDRDERLEIDAAALDRWRFTASFEQCSARHGAEATRRLVAGAALLACHRWPLRTRVAPDDLLPRLREHLATVEPRRPKARPGLSEFTPDAIPATDREFMQSLLMWSGSASIRRSIDGEISPRIPDQSPAAGRLLEDLITLRRQLRRQRRLEPESGEKGRDPDSAFIELVDPIVRGLARDTSTRPSSSDLGLTRLMVAVVDPQPGDVIVDLACGQGSTFIEAVRAAGSGGITGQAIGCIGRETDERVWTIAKIRLGLRGIAHDLGTPEDGLSCEMESRRSHRYICDPGLRTPRLRRWMQRHVELLGSDGVAALAVPAEIMFPSPRGRGRWWTDMQPMIDSVVFTPTDTAVLMLRHDAPEWKSLVQIHRMTAAMAERRFRDQNSDDSGVVPAGVAQRESIPLDAVDPAIEPFMPVQIRRVAEQIGSRLPKPDGDRKPREGDEDFVQWRPIRSLTLEALGEPRFGDCSAIRDAVPTPAAEPDPEQRAEKRGESKSVLQRGARTEPAEPRRRASRDRVVFAALRDAEKSDDTSEAVVARLAQELEAQALESVRVLRWLLDPTTLGEGTSEGRLSPKVNGALEELGTEEMRRALRRLELRLLGEETRGRRARPEPDASTEET